MVKAQKFIYNTRFSGAPRLTDFKLEEEDLHDLTDGGKIKKNTWKLMINLDFMFYIEVLAQAEYHSVDPYMRPYMEQYPVGVTMIGGQVCK